MNFEKNGANINGFLNSVINTVVLSWDCKDLHFPTKAISIYGKAAPSFLYDNLAVLVRCSQVQTCTQSDTKCSFYGV